MVLERFGTTVGNSGPCLPIESGSPSTTSHPSSSSTSPFTTNSSASESCLVSAVAGCWVSWTEAEPHSHWEMYGNIACDRGIILDDLQKLLGVPEGQILCLSFASVELLKW